MDDTLEPKTFTAETRHGSVEIVMHPTDAHVTVWRGGACAVHMRCSLNELVTICGVGAAAYQRRFPYFTQEDQDDLNHHRRTFKLGQIVHTSRAKDARLVARLTEETEKAGR